MVVVGGGNSAVTEALHLHNIGVQVTMVHRRDAFRAQDYLVKNISANDIPVLWNTEVKEIRGQERVSEVLLINNKTGETTDSSNRRRLHCHWLCADRGPGRENRHRAHPGRFH